MPNSNKIFNFWIDGLDRFGMILKPEITDKLMKKHVGKATKQNGAYIAKMMRNTIRYQKPGIVSNTLLTRAIKGSSKPLVDKGDLYQAITWDAIDTFSVLVGVDRNDENYELAEILSKGITIDVTPAMRWMFEALHRVSIGDKGPETLYGRAAELYERYQGPWYPLKETTTKIYIPPRPFIGITMSQLQVQQKVRENLNVAMAKVFAEMRFLFEK